MHIFRVHLPHDFFLNVGKYTIFIEHQWDGLFSGAFAVSFRECIRSLSKSWVPLQEYPREIYIYIFTKRHLYIFVI